jgi:hypothetical protein
MSTTVELAFARIVRDSSLHEFGQQTSAPIELAVADPGFRRLEERCGTLPHAFQPRREANQVNDLTEQRPLDMALSRERPDDASKPPQLVRRRFTLRRRLTLRRRFTPRSAHEGAAAARVPPEMPEKSTVHASSPWREMTRWRRIASHGRKSQKTISAVALVRPEAARQVQRHLSSPPARSLRVAIELTLSAWRTRDSRNRPSRRQQVRPEGPRSMSSRIHRPPLERQLPR